MPTLTVFSSLLVSVTVLKIVLILEFQHQGEDDHESVDDIGMNALREVFDDRPFFLDQRGVRLRTGEIGREFGYVVILSGLDEVMHVLDPQLSMLCLGSFCFMPPLSTSAMGSHFSH